MSDKTDATTDAVRQFYDEYGWVVDGEGSGADKSFRGESEAVAAYARVSTRRVLDALGDARGSVLFVGGGDMPESHMAVARTFQRIVCLDLSMVGMEAARRKLGDPERYVEMMKDYPGGRIATCEEIAHTVAFLASSKSAYTSGAEITIDAGNRFKKY